MSLTRRNTLKILGTYTALATIGGIPLVASGSMNPMPRMPLDVFVMNPKWLEALRTGVKEMKLRKPSDPLSWFFQAAIHGVTEEAINQAIKDDPNVPSVVKYWNQCPHHGQHSANFLPWHRAYTYYFEKILRLHTNDPSFSLPYWNYHPKQNRKFPQEFGIKHLDGNINNDTEENINPLFLDARDFYFTNYEHPFAEGLPLLELSDSAVDISLPMQSTVFFGETDAEGLGGSIADEDALTRGLLECYPHDQIHRAVGGMVIAPDPIQPGCEGTVGAMAYPPTAGFDPIFCVHHANIDRIWANWSCMPGKGWGKLPPKSWFDEKPWFFFETDGNIVNEPRKKYFDHRALGVRFYDEDPECKPLALPEMPSENSKSQRTVSIENHTRKFHIAANVTSALSVPAVQVSSIPISLIQHQELRQLINNLSKKSIEKRILMRIKDLQIGTIYGTGFDIHITSNKYAPLTRESLSFVGSIALFRHKTKESTHKDHKSSDPSEQLTDTFDVTKVMGAANESNLDNLHVVFAPYSLLEAVGAEKTRTNTVFVNLNGLTFSSIDFETLE